MHQRCTLQLIVSVLTLFGVMTIPDIVREGGDFVQRLKSENAWVVVLEKLRHGIGCARTAMRLLCRENHSAHFGMRPTMRHFPDARR